jgi:predicted transcriptional regulator
MPVVDAAGELVGVVSEADVIRDAVLPDGRVHGIPVHISVDPRPTVVSDVMSTHPVTVGPDTELSVATELLTSTVVKSLPVVERRQIVGMLSRRDIIRVLARQDSVVQAEIDELLRSSGEDWLVEVSDGVAVVEGPLGDAEQELAQVLVCSVPGVIGIHFKPEPRVRR